MIVPNYIPEPLEVPGNVAEARYAVRLRFIRTVLLLNFGVLGLIVGFSFSPLPAIGWPTASLGVAVLLLILDAWRVARRGSSLEARVSAWAIPLVALAFGWLARELSVFGWPLWASLIGPIFHLIYAFACGRDFSFVGSFVLAWIGSSVAIAGISLYGGMAGHQATLAIVFNTAILFYLNYDLSSAMARRRVGEEMAAVVDLYRDVFNIVGYIPRLVRHWKRHHIWNEVSTEVRRMLSR